MAGATLIAALQAVVLRAAVTHGGARADLNAANVQTLFNLSASHVQARRLYDSGFSLLERLPHAAAKAVL